MNIFIFVLNEFDKNIDVNNVNDIIIKMIWIVVF